MKVRLTNEEYNVLNKIASETNMDCWFHIGTDESDYDYIIDLENDERLPWFVGVGMLNDGIVPDLIDLTDAELATYAELLRQLGIGFNPFEDYEQNLAAIYDGNANGICTEED
jgi:hypothetical protein